MVDLLLITSQFPYGKDETFLETEILYLSKKTKLTIFPLSIKKEKRNISDNIDISIPKNFKFNILLFFRFLPVLFSEVLRNLTSFLKFKILLNSFFKSLQLYLQLQDVIIKIIKPNKKIIIYTYWMGDSTLAVVFLKKTFPNIIIISRVHGGDLYKERHLENYLPFREKIFTNIDKVFCISKHGQDYLGANYPLLKNKFELTYLGINNFNKNFKVQTEKFKIITCSHINPIKRLSLLIDSLSYIDLECEWTHVGYGFSYNEKPIFKKLVEVLKEHKFISYNFKGQIPNAEIIDFYFKENFSIFINVSKDEGLPVSMMEAMSCGIPCIGTNVGGVSELIKDCFNGYLLKSNPSENEVSSAIKKFKLLSKVEKDLMSYNAYKTWKTKFNAEKNYTEFAEIISNL